MRKYTFLNLFLILVSLSSFSQQRNSKTIHDSLNGFDARYFMALNIPEAKQDANYKALLARARRNYINQKYQLAPNYKPKKNPVTTFGAQASSASKQGSSTGTISSAPEICDNGLDDDSDGLIDLNDPDCNCSGFSSTTTVPSLIPNADFEQMNCCPTGYSQVNCATGWVQATSATSDYFNCGYNFGAASAAGIVPLPAANGSGYLGAIFANGWQEYVGACLSTPMLAGTPYQLSMSVASSWIDGFGDFCQTGAPPPINITLYGNASCANLPAGGTGCPGGSWVPIGSILYNPVNAWGPIVMSFTPTFNVATIMVGSPCTLPAGYNGSPCYAYFYFDNMVLNTTNMFNSTTIVQTGGLCTNNLVLTASATSTVPGGTWQWYKGGIAIVGQTSNVLNVSALALGSGTYNVKFTLNGSCEVVNKVILPAVYPVVNFSVNAACFGSTFSFSNTSSTATGTNSYVWNFGNASPATTVTSPNYQYPAAGNYTVTLTATNTDGCKDSLKKNLSVFALPIADFNLNNLLCGVPSLTATSTSLLNGGSAISNYVYNWNDGTPNSLVNPAPHTYATSGPKQIKLLITNANGCKDSITKAITITQKPTAGFTVNPICSGSISNFTNTSSTPSGVNSYTWNFGNGSAINTAVNPSYQYPVSGNYVVTLVAENTDGCKDTASTSLNIYGRASLNFGPTSVCFNTPTTFYNLTSTSVNPNTASVISWLWNFGSSSTATSTAQNPVFTYTNALNETNNSTYSAMLIAITGNGCKDSIILPVTVYSLPSPNFTADSVCLNKLTTLSDASNSNGNPIALFKWDFNQDGIADASNTSLSTTTTFPAFGNTPVTHTVLTNPSGTLFCSAAITKNVWVHPLPNASITNTNTCIDTQPSLISGVSSTIPIGTISNYAWNYGNGSTSLTNGVAATSFSYIAAGNYPVTLTVTSNAGCTNATTQTISVWEKPYGDFAYTKTCFGKRTTLTGFQSAVSGNIANYGWDVNNTPLSVEINGAQVNHTFTAAGLIPVNLLLTSVNGCKNMISRNIYINHNPSPKFFAPKRAGCTDFCLNIKDSTQAIPGPAKIIDWNWDFGNGGTFQSANGNLNTICYTNQSNTNVQHYSVKLVLKTDSGCVDSLTKNNFITVYPNPVADFNWKGISGDILFPKIEFTNTSIGYSKFAWYFNDGINITDSATIHPIHNFDTDLPRDYNVFLAVRNQYGCKDTTQKYIVIEPACSFYIPNAFTPNGDGINDIFTGKGIGIKTYNMWIFDRWGEKIFYTNDIDKGWDGTVKGKMVEDKTDVYQWRVVLSDYNNKKREYVGHVTLIK